MGPYEICFKAVTYYKTWCHVRDPWLHNSSVSSEQIGYCLTRNLANIVQRRLSKYFDIASIFKSQNTDPLAVFVLYTYILIKCPAVRAHKFISHIVYGH